MINSLRFASFKGLIVGISSLLGLTAWQANAADPLKIAYGQYQSPPYAVLDDGYLEGGLIFDLGNAIAEKMGRFPSYIATPRKRLVTHMGEGRVALRCHLSPFWLKDADSLLWSDTLYQSHTVAVAKKPIAQTIKKIDDFQNHRIGTVLGYIYSKELTTMFDSGKATRIDAPSLDNSLQMLASDRVDMVMGTELILLNAVRERNMTAELDVIPIHIRSQDIKCAVSPHPNFPQEEILKAINSLKEEGIIAQILAKYIS